MTNPNKYIRGGIITALGTTYPVWYKRIPKTVATPDKYILIQSQSKQEAFRGKKCYEWLCQVNIDIWVRGTQGFPPTTATDDLEEHVITKMEESFAVSGFTVKYIDLINQYEDSAETDTHSIERRTLTYELWLNKK